MWKSASLPAPSFEAHRDVDAPKPQLTYLQENTITMNRGKRRGSSDSLTGKPLASISAMLSEVSAGEESQDKDEVMRLRRLLSDRERSLETPTLHLKLMLSLPLYLEGATSSPGAYQGA